MKKIRIIAIFALIIAFAGSFSACKKVKDADLKTAITTALAANPDLGGLSVDVQKQVVTLTGEVKDEAAVKVATDLAKAVKGVKNVVSNITVKPPVPVENTAIQTPADQALEAALIDALKDNAGIKAAVKDGVVTLTGEIAKAQLPKLMQKISALKPAKIDNQLTIK